MSYFDFKMYSQLFWNLEEIKEEHINNVNAGELI